MRTYRLEEHILFPQWCSDMRYPLYTTCRLSNHAGYVNIVIVRNSDDVLLAYIHCILFLLASLNVVFISYALFCTAYLYRIHN